MWLSAIYFKRNDLHGGLWPRPCENVDCLRQRRTSRRISSSEQSIHVALARKDCRSEKFIFYISKMCEFSHSLDPYLPTRHTLAIEGTADHYCSFEAFGS